MGNGNFWLEAFHHADYFEGSRLLICWLKFSSWFTTPFSPWKWHLNCGSSGLGSWMGELRQACVGIIWRNWCHLLLYFNIQMSHGQDKNMWVYVVVWMSSWVHVMHLGPQYGDIERYGSAKLNSRLLGLCKCWHMEGLTLTYRDCSTPQERRLGKIKTGFFFSLRCLVSSCEVFVSPALLPIMQSATWLSQQKSLPALSMWQHHGFKSSIKIVN